MSWSRCRSFIKRLAEFDDPQTRVYVVKVDQISDRLRSPGGGALPMRGAGMKVQLALFVTLLVLIGAGLAYVVALGLLHR